MKALAFVATLLFCTVSFAGTGVVFEIEKLTPDEFKSHFKSVTEPAKRNNLLGHPVVDINAFEPFQTARTLKERLEAQRPEVVFTATTKTLWSQLGFQGEPKLIDETNIFHALKMPNRCRPEASRVYEATRDYHVKILLNRANEAHKLWLARIRPRLSSDYMKPCTYYINASYVLASVASLDFNQSFYVHKGFHTKTGYRLSRNMPMLLLTTFLINKKKLILFPQRSVDYSVAKNFWRPAVVDKKELRGAYFCKNPVIFLAQELKPYDAAGIFYHELSHMFRDIFANQRVAGTKFNERLLMDEVVAVLTGALWQIKLIDQEKTIFNRGITLQDFWNDMIEVGLTPKNLHRTFHYLARPDDYSLFAPKGALVDLFREIYGSWERRSMAPGVLPAEMYPTPLPISLDFLADFVDLVMLQRDLKKKKLTFTWKTKAHILKALKIISKAYFPNNSWSEERLGKLPQLFSSQFDPLSQWMKKADQHLLFEKSIDDVLVEDPEGKYEFDGKRWSQSQVVSGPKTEGPETLGVELGRRGDTTRIRYDLQTPLRWLYLNQKRFQQTSKNCSEFLSTPEDQRDYLGFKMRINLGPGASELMTEGPNGGKTDDGGNGGKTDGGNGGKTGDGSVRAGQYLVRPYIKIPDL